MPLSLALAGCEATEPSPTPESRIAFQVSTASSVDIYSARPDGSDLKPFLIGPADDAEPHWAPGGRLLAFSSNRDGQEEIYVVGRDGADPRNLTNSPAQDRAPAWSPDGSTIVFASARRNMTSTLELFLMNADGTNQRPLVMATPVVGTEPEWSPDGSAILFLAPVGPINEAVFLIDPNGANLRQLTFPGPSESDQTPAWAPDAQSIVFARAEYEPQAILRLAVVSLVGGSPTLLPSSPDSSDADPVFSPSGAELLFTRQVANGFGPPRLLRRTVATGAMVAWPASIEGWNASWSDPVGP